MIKVFVSGCFDILHGGHIEFFNQAKSYGDYLIVCIASDRVLDAYKERKSSLNVQHKINLIKSLRMVDKVVIGDSIDNVGLNFIDEFLKEKPNYLIVTEDDKYSSDKIELCNSIGCKYISVDKTLNYEKVSTTDIINFIKAPKQVPLRVDFVGGWLDVPKLSMDRSYIINCTITPFVGLDNWVYNISSGLGGSAAYSILCGKNAIESELDIGVGWQDPAVIQETGLCVWESGKAPVLKCKYNPSFLNKKMALFWTGSSHNTPSLVDHKRDYNMIANNSEDAMYNLMMNKINYFYNNINNSYKIQLDEGMKKLPNFDGTICKKYCGGGWGGYAVYIFENTEFRDSLVNSNSDCLSIEPYIKSY
jgi:cytidyltransferase-like protein